MRYKTYPRNHRLAHVTKATETLCPSLHPTSRGNHCPQMPVILLLFSIVSLQMYTSLKVPYKL